jgi:hypothetical protein
MAVERLKKHLLLAQRVVLPGMVITAVTCLLSPIYNWLFIFKCVFLSGAWVASVWLHDVWSGFVSAASLVGCMLREFPGGRGVYHVAAVVLFR